MDPMGYKFPPVTLRFVQHLQPCIAFMFHHLTWTRGDRCLERLHTPQRLYLPLRQELARYFAKALAVVAPPFGDPKKVKNKQKCHRFLLWAIFFPIVFFFVVEIFFQLKKYQDDNELGKKTDDMPWIAVSFVTTWNSCRFLDWKSTNKEMDVFSQKVWEHFWTWKWTVWCTISKMLLPFSRVSSCRKISDDCMRDCDSGDHVWSLISVIQWIIIRIIYLYTNQKISVFCFKHF